MNIKSIMMTILLLAIMIGTFAVEQLAQASAHISGAVTDRKITPKLEKLQNYSDWMVGCDNLRTCLAVSLKGDFRNANAPNVTIERTSELQPAIEVQISNLSQPAERYKIIIDGKLVDTGVLNHNVIIVTSADALKLARAMVKGYRMEIFDSTDRSLGKVSLSGSSAAMRYMDERQNIARTSIAFAAHGNNGYSKKSYPLPHIAVRKIEQTGIIPSVNDILELSQVSGCDKEQFGVNEDRAYSLGQKEGKPIALALISCGRGAYNLSSALYLGSQIDGEWRFVPARLDFGDGDTTTDNGANILVNVGWDEDKQIMTSFYKGRGIGDCGNSAEYVWDGANFRLISASRMDRCRGAADWITLWQAKPIFIEDPIGEAAS